MANALLDKDTTDLQKGIGYTKEKAIKFEMMTYN